MAERDVFYYMITCSFMTILVLFGHGFDKLVYICSSMRGRYKIQITEWNGNVFFPNKRVSTVKLYSTTTSEAQQTPTFVEVLP